MATLLQSEDKSHVSQVCAEYSLSSTQFTSLHSRSVAAKATAYCPYSQFRVGATILTEDGQYIDGANVENAAYPVGTCAERVAFGKAVTEGHKKFKAVAVATDISPPASPCGMCRQLAEGIAGLWRAMDEGDGDRRGYPLALGLTARTIGSIREFCDLQTPIFMFDKDGAFVVMKLEQLLPLSFGPEALPSSGSLPARG